jgi:hypothetical protein
MRQKIFVLLVTVAFAIATVFGPFEQFISAQGSVSTFSTLRVTNFFRAQPRAALTVTNNGTINASGTIQRLTSATAVGTAGTNVTIEPAGTILTLVNVGANTITITETGVFTSAGNIALGAGDSATLYSNGAAWLQIGASNN